MTSEERQLAHEADVQRVSAAYNTLPTAAQVFVDKYRGVIERAGRMSPYNNAWQAYSQFVWDMVGAFSGTAQKVAGTPEQGTGV